MENTLFEIKKQPTRKAVSKRNLELSLQDESLDLKEPDAVVNNKIEAKQADRKHLQDKVIRLNVDPDSVCSLCVKVFLSPGDLEIHRQRVHVKKLATLSKGRKTSFIDRIIDNGVDTYYCNVCSFKSDVLSCYKEHMKPHYELNLTVISITKDAPYIYESSDKSYHCNFCEFKCNEESLMIVHAYKPNHCELYAKKFDNLATLDNHTRTHTGEKPYEGNKQDSLSNDLNSTDTDSLDVTKQDEHVNLDDPEIEAGRKCKKIKDKAYYGVVNNTYRCTICPFGTKDLTIIRNHFKEHNITKVLKAPSNVVAKELYNNLQDYLYDFCDTFYRCKVCDFKSPEHDLIKQHVYNFHINLTTQCEVCTKSFVSLVVLKVHQGDFITRQYKCLKCKYTSLEPLNEHMESHPNMCFKCDSTNSKPPTKQSKFDKTDILHHCSLCNCKFDNITSWFAHVQYHTESTPRVFAISKNAQYVYDHCRKHFQCNLCEFNTFIQSAIKRHVDRVHLGIKQHQCEICGKRFFSSTALVRHVRTHTGEKPYKCTLCNFASNMHISKHMKVHSKIKPYHCKVCEYKSPDKPRLKLHMRTHTGEKPFKCMICDYAATHKVSLINHMKSKHENAA